MALLAACAVIVVFDSDGCNAWPAVVALMPSRCGGALKSIDGCNSILLAVVGVNEIADRNPYTLLLYSLDISVSDGIGGDENSSAFLSSAFSL